MLIAPQTAFALRCPQCGQLEMAALSRFELHGNHTVRLSCSCGTPKLVAGSKRGQVWLQIPCYLCDSEHFLYYTPKSFWGPELKLLACNETDLQLGVFGPEHEVDTYARTGGTELERLLEDAAFGEYFESPAVMSEALSRVHLLAEEDRLHCRCGNRQISVEIYPERLDLVCSDCGRYRTVMAATEEDLAVLERMQQIEVGEEPPTRRTGHKK